MLAFLWVNLKLILGTKQRLRESTRRIPMRFAFEEVPAEKLTQAQKDYMKPVDDQLAALNYFPLATFRITNFNFGTTLHRRYGNPTDPVSCALTIVEVKAKVGETEAVKNSWKVKFASKFPDKRILTTSSKSLKSLFDQPPWRIAQNYPNATNLSELKRKHDARARELGAPISPAQDIAKIFEELQAEHERHSNFQVERGIYRVAPEGGAYAISEKIHLRALRNHYLPFGRRLSFSKLLFSALVGAVFPLFGILKLSPMLGALHTNLQFLELAGAQLAVAACYVAAGMVIGYVCEGQKLTWIYLITYVPAHLVAGWTFGVFPYSLLAFVANHYVGQARRRQKLILQT
ncbi:MAG TPA: hypothetical protein VE263_12245 [Candidatus Angelobacter sp.]|nr:hypothetical protein [Candidatus Angelobacter sp.]